MQFRGFTFGHIEVEAEGRAHDLHNFYAASAIHYAALERTLILRFTRRTEDWVPPEEARQITVKFREVSYFRAEGRDPDLAEDDCVLHAIGTVESGAETKNFYLADNIPADQHLVVCFASGLTLRIQAEEAICEIDV
ncbi:hypothetical protein FHJ31_02815 [Pseudomonas sp. Fig-3]|uniref:hypothetical protein n=1 Tax=Pseudomonas TaxID=286 RepID=UPI0010E1E2BB|nr:MULTISPECIES: hypothetical protein [unclassified Pseudomonas]MBD0705980.1 hypothetical protein [Pseudomonas sp. PSB1]MDD2032162.1 hypothetical protein [Pseudomonas sp. 39167]MDR8388838.1 hypothetical protein [Pseudomonas sp. JL2]MEA1029930.1 hypothetical protein [Pseudomonas sp. N-137]TNB89267.1 hypothetical protein FHJ31_02815 [Pseudomonas sp. Fig-3]